MGGFLWRWSATSAPRVTILTTWRRGRRGSSMSDLPRASALRWRKRQGVGRRGSAARDVHKFGDAGQSPLAAGLGGLVAQQLLGHGERIGWSWLAP